ncbi:MAG: TlpA family protein disulfide reductase [Marinifilaceae bacterium]
MSKLNTLKQSKLAILILGLILGGAMVSVPWYFAWQAEMRDANATFFEKLLDEPEELKAPDSIRTLGSKELDWVVRDLHGTETRLKEFSGRVVFLNFWATWCAPCVAELPGMAGLTRHYKGNDQIEFLFLTNQSAEPVKRLLKRKPHLADLPYYHYEEEGLPELFHSTGIPYTLILNKRGEVVVEHLGSALWDTPKVFALLDDLIAE